MKTGGFQIKSVGSWLGNNKAKIGAVLAAVLLVLQLIPSVPTSAQGNLIGYWKFDEATAGGTAVDSSGRGNDAEPTNDPVPSDDIPDAMGEAFADPHSVSFDGSTQYFTAGNDGSFDNTDAVSISVWVKFDTVNGTNQTIVGRWHVSKYQQWVLQLNASNKIAFWTGDGSTGGDNLESANTVSADTWYHIVATATNGAKELYINGQSSNSNTAGSMGLAAAADVTIGSKLSSEDAFFEFLDGTLDDLRVYDRVLSVGEIAELAVGSQTSAVWTGSISSDWNTAGNWNIDAVPDAHTNVTIPKTATHPVLTQTTAAAKVTVSSGGILDLNGFDLTTNDSNVTVVGTLISKNTESSTDIDASYGTIMYKHTDNATGLVFGNDYHNLILNDGLVGYWPLDESIAGSTAADWSGYDDEAIPTGDPTPSTDVAANIKFANSRSLAFDGSNYLSVPDAPHLDLTDQLTVAAWVKPASLGQQMQIITKSTTNDMPATYSLYIDSSGRPAFQLHDGDNFHVITSDSAIQANEWTHLAGVYDGSNMFLYVNGDNVASDSTNAPATNGVPLTIGGFSDTQKFNGLIDDVRVYSRGLGSDEANRLGTGEQPAATLATTTLDGNLNIGQTPAIGSGLIGYWAMDESSADDPVVDSSGKGHNGTPVGSPQPSVDRPSQIAASQNPYSLSFNGSNYVNLGADAGDITTGDFTLSTWFKTSYTSGFQYFMSKRSGSVGYEIGIDSSVGNEGKIYIYLGDGNSPSVSWRVSTKDYRDGEWHHLAVTFDRDGNAQVYVDGSATGSPVDVSGHQGSLSVASPLVFGEFFAAHNQRLVGNLDDARIYDRVLSADDISQLYGGNLGLDGAGSLTLNGGTLDVSESNYTINLAGDFENNGGVLEAQQGTVNLTGGDQTINSSNTFYNLVKDISSGFTEPQTLTFGGGSTTTVNGDLTFTGASGAELSLASSSSGKAWNISINGTATLSYLAVSDSNNTGATLSPADSTDGGDNTNWNLNAPNTPSNLGPENYTDGSFNNDTTPTLTFDLSDPDAGTTVGYRIQIDNDSDFSSPVVDYTSELDTQGSSSFTVGQNTGGGSYTAGSSGQTLSDGAYYWRVKTIDVGGFESAYVAANGGSAAFSIDTAGPTAPGQPSPAASPTDDATPSWSWAASTDDGAGLGSPAYTVEWSQDSDFNTVTDSATTDDTTFTHTDELGDGTWYLRVKAVDDLGNESDWSDAGSVVVDATAPSKPGTPTATSPTSDNTPAVSWSASTDDGSGLGDPAYTLEWSDDSSFEGGADGSVTTNNTNASPSSALADGTWYFRVTVTDQVGNTNTSDVSSGIVIDSTAPTAPGKPSATSPTSDNTPAVSWSAASDSGVGLKDPAYRLEWSNSATFDGGADGSVTTNDTSASPDSTLADGTWYFRVVASDALDNTTTSPISDGVLIDTTGPTQPGTPGTPSPTTDTTPTWTWDASTDDGAELADPAYTVEWSQAADFSSVAGSSTSSSNSFTHTTELADSTWYLRVKAEDAVGNESSWSDAGSVLIDSTAPSKPGTPTGTSPTSDATPTISWDASDDTGAGLADPAYLLEWSDSATFDGGPDGAISTNGTSASPPSPLDDGTWYFRVTVEDTIGNTVTSDISSGIVIDTTPPSAPGKPAAAASPTNDNTPLISWSAASDSGAGLKNPAYTLEWSDSATFTGGADGSTTTNATSASPDSNLADGTWYFRVIATDAVDNAATSPISDAVVIDATAPTTPGTPSTASPATDTTPTWQWAASSDDGVDLADPAYTVEWSRNSDFSTVTGTGTTNDTSFTHTTALADGIWYFRVRATDAVNNTSDWSTTGSTNIDNTPPAVSNIAATTGDVATKRVISWTTNEPASSQVSYGPTASYDAATVETDTSPRVTSHSVTLTNLVPCSIYHFAVRSEDSVGNVSTSSDQLFITAGCAGDAGVLDQATKTVSTGLGGSLALDTVTLIIPADYSDTTANFQIKQINPTGATNATGTPNGLKLASSKVYDIKALIDQENAIDSFDEPITITLSYTDPEIANLIENSLWIYRWNSGTGWNALDDCVVNQNANTVTCTTPGFSTFALYGTEKPAEPEPESDSGGNPQNEASGSTNSPNTGDTPVSNTANDSAEPPAGSGSNADGRDPASPADEEDDPVTITQVSVKDSTSWWWLLIPIAAMLVWWLLAARRKRRDDNKHPYHQ